MCMYMHTVHSVIPFTTIYIVYNHILYFFSFRLKFCLSSYINQLPLYLMVYSRSEMLRFIVYVE